jgi:hypothetical protein
MTTTETIDLKNGSLAMRFSIRGIGRRRIAGAIATIALGLVIFAGGPVGPDKSVAAAESSADNNFAVVEAPYDASISTTYRWDFEVYPSR